MSLMVTYLLRFMANKIGFYNPEVGKKILHHVKATCTSYYTTLQSAINDISLNNSFAGNLIFWRLIELYKQKNNIFNPDILNTFYRAFTRILCCRPLNHRPRSIKANKNAPINNCLKQPSDAKRKSSLLPKQNHLQKPKHKRYLPEGNSKSILHI